MINKARIKWACALLLSVPSLAFSSLNVTNQHHENALYPDWRGFYIGGLAGTSYAKFNTTTTTQSGPLLSASQASFVNVAGKQEVTPDGFLAGIEAGYNWQFKRLLLGLEGDFQALSNSATTNSNAILYGGAGSNILNSTQFVLTTYGNANWLLTVRPRIGFIGDIGVFYITGGLAATSLQSDFIFVDDNDKFESKQLAQLKLGYVGGAGFETALSHRLSVKAEYLISNFGTTNAHSMNHNMPDGQLFKNSANLKMGMLRLGLNYHLEDKNNKSLSLELLPILTDESQWSTEVGIRPFVSTGLVGTPNPLLNDPGGVLASRLIFSDLNAVSLETYARADHKMGFFAKGFLGAGSIGSGHLNDEDFPAGGAYSNTLSHLKGDLSYLNIDIGFSPLRTPHANSGIFVGYHYFAENVKAYGCRQLAGAQVCVPENDFNNVLGLSDQDNFKSLRIGLVSTFDITEQLKINAEAAYLPLVNYQGQDNHNLRQLIGPEESNYGNGAMLESVLAYQLNNAWSVGVGARYWMWNMHKGSLEFDFLGVPPISYEPARYNAYRYGVFLQINYQDKKAEHIHFSLAPFKWQGLYIGGHLGGAWADSKWSDPFASTPGYLGSTNVAGFGDQIHATGPIGGADVYYYWQRDKWVYGVGAKVNVADIRGENTVFSGIGGLNAQTVINYWAAIIGKIGTQYHRSLFYINVGPVLMKAQYHVNGNADELWGAQNQEITKWGYLAGAGIEYAINDHWTTSLEYDYVSVSGIRLSFPDIQTVNTHQYHVNQSINNFSLGLNYKL